MMNTDVEEKQSFLSPLFDTQSDKDGEFQDARSRDSSATDVSYAYTDARSASKTSAHGVYPVWKQNAKNFACYTFAVMMGSLFIFTTFCAIWHNNVYSYYDPTTWVIDYSAPSNSLSAQPAGSGVLLTSLAAEGWGTVEKPISVTLLGDSLVVAACVERDLTSRVASRLAAHTSLKFNIWCHGQPGCTVSCLAQNISAPLWMKEDQSTVVLVMSNSDVSNSNPHMSVDAWTQYKADYQVALASLTDSLTEQVGAGRWALAGPSVLTEGPLFKPPRLAGFDDMLQDIRSINEQHLQNIRGKYIDMWGAIKSISVKWWPIYSLYATEDGEHLSDLGVDIQADNFVQFLIN